MSSSKGWSPLVPDAAKEVLEIIVQFANLNQSKVLITTHSPHILTATNLLYSTSRIRKALERLVESVLRKETWIPTDQSSAYKLKQNEKGAQTEPLVDKYM